ARTPTPAVSEKEVKHLSAALDTLEEHLADKNNLVGNQLTEPDIRIYNTFVRVDPYYFVHLKCNINALVDYQKYRNYN
ncbi:glutathione S-transferase C-terminal domain-containing protein, partial [Streptococcus suis]